MEETEGDDDVGEGPANSATITTTIKPSNRYQMTVPQGVRQMLGIDGKAAAIEVDVKVKRRMDPEQIE